MSSALIGYTGFVGGNLDAQHAFDDKYNTKNIDDIDGKEYDLVVSAATYAEMWKINANPEEDWERIASLIEHLKTVKAKQFVLISTICVFKDPVDGFTEDTPVDLEGLPPYGVHRYKLEQFVREHFPNALIVRLPGLYGAGLKKNIIFDLMHDNNVERIHKDASVQYYNLGHIWSDIQIALDNQVTLLHLSVGPTTTQEVAKAAFDMEFTNAPADVHPKTFDFHSKHAGLFGGTDGYLYSKQQSLDEIKNFVAEQGAA